MTTYDTPSGRKPADNAVGAWMADMALDLHAADDSEHLLERIIEYAVTAIGCDAAGVMLLESGDLAGSAAATSPEASRAGELHLELDEGPCLQTFQGGGAFMIGDTRHDHRWPTWGARVAELGYLSVITVPLRTHERRYGALNVFGKLPEMFGADDLGVAAIFASHAAVAVATSRTEGAQKRAIDSRKLIGQAQGILMERFDLDTDRAFDVLRRYSQDTNTKLRDVAQQIVDRRVLPTMKHPARKHTI